MQKCMQLVHAFRMYIIQGNIDLACELGEEATEFAEKSADLLPKSFSHTQYGCALFFKGQFEKAETFLLDGLGYSKQTSQSALESWAAWGLGDYYSEKGLLKKANDYYLNAIHTLENAKIFPSIANAIKTESGRTMGHTQIQEDTLHQFYEYFEKNKYIFSKGLMAKNIATTLLYMSDDRMAESEDWIHRAIEADTKHGTRWYLARDHALYADWFQKKGDPSKAREQLSRAIEVFAECGADGWVAKYTKKLNSLP